MLGAIIGDIAGSKYEFNNVRTEDFEFIGPGCDCKRLRMDVGPVGKLSSGPCCWQRPQLQFKTDQRPAGAG